MSDIYSAMPPIEPSLFRYVMGHYPTGVVVVTAMVDDKPVGMVLGTFSSVSLEPPLVSFMPTQSSQTWQMLARGDHYVINVLAHDQQDVCTLMARRDPAKFEKVGWYRSEANGAPVLEGVVSAVACSPEQIIEAGDHLIVLCAVQHLDVVNPTTPLLFFQGGYGSFSTHSMLARVETPQVPKVMKARVGQHEMDALAQRLDCESAIMVEVGEDELVTAATAYGPSTIVSERLGEIIPMIPPVGDMFISMKSREAQERWVNKSLSKDEAVRQTYRERLAVSRRRRWSMSLTTPEDRGTFETVLRHLQEYSGAAHLTPGRVKEIQQVVENAAHLYEVTELQDDKPYFVGSIVVPLPEPDGSVEMVMRVSQLPAPALGSQVRVWQRELSATAQRISALMASQCPGQ